MSDAKPKSSRWTFWRVCRVAFRCVRIVAWLLVLAVLVAFLWFNQRGVPEFIKRPVLAELKARGVEVEFQRLRWQWFRGFVAEGIAVKKAEPSGPHFEVGELEVNLDTDELRQLRFVPSGVALRRGLLTWTLAPSNQPPQTLVVTNLATSVRFLPGDVWEVRQLDATVQGIRMKLSATVTNATALTKKPPSPPSTTTNVPPPTRTAPPEVETILHRVLTELARVQFAAPPEIELAVRADAKLERGGQAALKVKAAGVNTPWGGGRNASFTAKITQPPGTNGAVNADFRLEAEQVRVSVTNASTAQLQFSAQLHRGSTRSNDWDATWELALRAPRTPWAEAATLRLPGQAAPRALAPDELRANLAVHATQLKSEWAKFSEGRITGTATVAPERKQLLAADADVQITAPETKWGEAKQARVSAKAARRSPGAAAPVTGGFWTNLAPWQLDTTVALDGVKAPEQKLDVNQFNFTAHWRAPELVITNLHSELYGGALDASSRLDVASRALAAAGGFDFDAYRIQHLFDANTRREMSRFTFNGLPKVRAGVAVVLPEWTNRAPDWRVVGESVSIAAHVDSPGGTYRNSSYLEARTDLTLTNSILRLRNLWARRPEGEVHFEYDVNPRTKEFHYRGRAQVFPQAVEPLLERPEEKAILTNFTFTVPPQVEGEVWGRWGAQHELAFRASAVVTNFILRGQQLDAFRGAVNFTNQFYAITNVYARRGTGEIHAPNLGVDGRFTRLWVTNAQSTFEPVAFMSMIGPHTVRALRPYVFSNAPAVQVSGSVPFREAETPDLHFTIAGGPFRWSFFLLPEVNCEIHWVTNRLRIAKLDGAFHGGRLVGDLNFDVTPKARAEFGFNLAFTNASLPGFISEISGGKPNKLEGAVTGRLVVTNANTADWQSWQGFGDVRLTDGLLWDIPIFGLFSPVLNAINKGLGSSRAKEAKGTFILTTSVIYTKNLEIHSPPARLHYDGTVDFAGGVNANVEAEMFRDAFLVGPLLSLLTTPMTKVFEYHVTGSLANPKSEPRFIPKFLMLPLRPFQTIREFLTPDKPEPEKK
ncbi:MAG: AsmA-like C-terminal region-containing protein [Limisphaerales bacterium]